MSRWRERAELVMTLVFGLAFLLVFLMPTLSEFRWPWLIDLWRWVWGPP